ncbi:MAG: hypothetical protein RUMPE_00696 [Eubacteriales bacterium SKADARSKE-1]|nr:hypothetical protein [Eubacteriales bacterium SKADARSKE-1]
MMAIKQWTLAVTFSAIACTILETLSPNGKFEKIIRLVLGAFMLCAVLFPLKTTIRSINFNLDKNNSSIDSTKNNLKNKINDETQVNAEENVKKMIVKTLKEKNIEVKKINVFMDMKEDNCISINKVEIHLNENDKEKKEEVIKLIEKTFGIKTVVSLGSG